MSWALFDPEQFRGKVVMVTGAGKGSGPGGIGYNVALAFARAGARLSIIGRTEETLRRTVEEIETLGGECVFAAGDVADPGAIERLFAETEEAFGRLDILINNAGISGEVRALVRIPPASYRYAWNVHLHTMTTTRLAARLMRERGIRGAILNVGTYFTSPHRQILRPYPFRTPYTGAQAWKLEHARASAWELARDGIRVIALNLGPVEGGRIDSIVYPLGALERGLWGREVAGADIRRKTEEMHPGGRFLTQEHAARSIVALVSEELRDAANGTVVELAGGVDYRVPPQVAPPIGSGPAPDLAGRQVLIAGRPAAAEAADLALAYAACGAAVVLAFPGAAAALRDLASGREPAAYGDGQRRLLGRMSAVDLDPADADQVAALFEGLTEGAEAPGLDAAVILTGEAETAAAFTDLSREEELRLKERFAFEPAALMRQALAVMLLLGNRRAGNADPRFLSLRPFLDLLGRRRGNPGPGTAVERLAEGFTAAEERALQAGARRATGSVIVVGPEAMGDAPDEAAAAAVARAGLQAVVSTVAAEMATARSRVRVNAIFPGGDGQERHPARTARLALRLSDPATLVSGMIYAPDERNAASPGPGPLSGRTAVVTGGGRNMGQAIALRLAREGARLVLTGRNQGDLEVTARAIRALGGQATEVVADVALPGGLETVLETARRFGANGSGATGPDLWVNNAGIGGAFATLAEIELDGEARWHQTLAVDFTGAWLGMARAILHMRSRRARGGVVNVSTFYADQPYVFRIPYTVPKVLLKTCASLLADALRPYGIFVADIRPSLIDGPRFQWVAKNYAEQFRRHGVADPLDDPRIRDWFHRLVPGSAPSQEDVAEAVAFAARRGLSGSGQEIPVSTLPVRPQAGPAGDGRAPLRPGDTVVLVCSGRSRAEIDRAGAFASFCLEEGARRVVVAADDGMLARLAPHLSRRSATSPWWNLPAAARGDGRLEIRGVDPASAASVAELFAGLGEADTVIHLPGAPRPGERFVMFPADPALAGLDAAAVEERYAAHRRALSLFLERRITAGLIVLRQAARALAPAGCLAVSQAPPRSPEGILAAAALRQMIRTAAEEFRLLGSERRAVYAPRLPATAARPAAFAPRPGASATASA